MRWAALGWLGLAGILSLMVQLCWVRWAGLGSAGLSWIRIM